MAYKRRFSDEDVKLMEQDAAAAERITAAERQMALAGNSFNNRNNQIADLTAAAHERRIASRRHFVETNPGAVSPQERDALTQTGLTGRERAIQDFERGMLQDKIKGEVGVAEAKRMGMENQGVGAAKINAEASITNTEREWAGRAAIGSQQGEDAVKLEQERQKGALSQHEREWGTTGADGTHKPGGRERITEIEGKSRVDAAKAQAEAQAQAQAQKNALEEQKRIAAAEKEKGRLKLQYDKLDQKDRAAVDSAANSLAKEKGISFEDARAQVMAAGEQSQQQAGKKVRSYRYNADRTKRIPVYEDGSQGPAEDVK